MPSGLRPSNAQKILQSAPPPAYDMPSAAVSNIPMDLKPLTAKWSPTVKEYANYKNSMNSRVDIIDELNQGNRIEEKGLLQLDHAFNLAKYSTENEATRQVVDKHRNELRDALAQNDLSRHLKETGQDPSAGLFEYKGEKFDINLGKDLMDQEHDFLIKTDRFMTNPEVKNTKGKLLETSRELGKTSAFDNLNPNKPIESRSIDEIADAWDGKKPGTKSKNESGGLYRYLQQSPDLHANQDRIMQYKHDQHIKTLTH